MMYNHIVIEPASTIRLLARSSRKSRMFELIFAVLVAEVIRYAPGIFGDTATGLLADLINAVSFIIVGPIFLGLANFFLKIARQESTRTTDIFLGFDHFVNALTLHLLITIYVFLWSLLFVIPGFVALFKYSQAYFIMADDPTKSATQCLNESKAMMDGNKGKLFSCLAIYLPAYIVIQGISSSLDAVVIKNAGIISALPEVNEAVAQLAKIGEVGTPLMLLYSLILIVTTVFIGMTMAMFYELLTEHLVVNRVTNSRGETYVG